MSTSLDRMYPAGQVSLREVGLRDGLQMVRSYPSSEEKEAWLRAEHAAGIRHFEVGSYLPAAAFPQFADVDRIVDAAQALPDAFAATLVLNRKGALRALEGAPDEVVFVVSASEAHNLANARRTRDTTLADIIEAIGLLRAGGDAPVINVAIAMAYGCSISGKDSVGQADVLGLAETFLAEGADVLTIADTVGYAAPPEVAEMTRSVRALAGARRIAAHFHDTRGLAIANAAAALEHGCDILDASLGGLGGCPFAPNASGNAVMEDMAFLAQTMGFATGVDVSRLIAARAVLAAAMPQETLHGALASAGLPRRREDLVQA